MTFGKFQLGIYSVDWFGWLFFFVFSFSLPRLLPAWSTQSFFRAGSAFREAHFFGWPVLSSMVGGGVGGEYDSCCALARPWEMIFFFLFIWWGWIFIARMGFAFEKRACGGCLTSQAEIFLLGFSKQHSRCKVDSIHGSSWNSGPIKILGSEGKGRRHTVWMI